MVLDLIHYLADNEPRQAQEEAEVEDQKYKLNRFEAVVDEDDALNLVVIVERVLRHVAV